MRNLVTSYRSDPRTAALIAACQRDEACTVGAVQGGLAAVLLAACLDQLPAEERPGLIVTNDPERLLDDLEELGLDPFILPELDEHDLAQDEDAHPQRLQQARRAAALEAYQGGTLLLATPHAVDQPVPHLRGVSERSLRVAPEQEWDIGELADRMVSQHYSVTNTVEKPGQLAIRGGILDVWPLAAEHPVRIEFFGDEIETVRLFDAFTQESIRHIDEAVLTTQSGLLADSTLWQELRPGPIFVLSDLALAPKLKHAHGRQEIRLARRLESDAVDGASIGIDRFLGDLRKDLQELSSAASEGSLSLWARNDEAVSELQKHLDDHGITAEVAVGRLSAGFRDLERGLLVLHDFELSHRRPTRRRKDRQVQGSVLSSFTDLKQGDYVVHINHGLARFRGMATLEKRGYLEDFLLLEFAEDSKLYLPVSAIDLVQKYIGGAGRHPDLSKMGGTSWKRKKAKAEKAVEDMAAELLATHAERQAAKGIAFAPDDSEQRRFETSFPYEETEDQLAAAREIKASMEAGPSMDRLLCGDVGFGKTEVAMRAVCKAVLSGYQVAVLAPTTLLAEQHATTFESRFADTGANIACINRFRTGQERQHILDGCRDGSVDIVIGTHALLSEKLKFAKLGLLVVDEEHRFGVKHKEKLKQAKSGVDVLTLSATPIPRTLHFSLTGLRDISVLSEAPASRLAINTQVSPWDKALIRSAIERELARDGQIFFIHNRVKDIDAIAARLSRLVPDMRLAIIHGQMPERRIAETMLGFEKGSIDCLLSTSIVESGIDIPNANTLFVNNAHCFGLSELHQFRGRIGRFTRQAHAYFLIPADRALNQEASERLDAIEEYSELGAGFKLAMRDLEIRGAGNLLGPEQSGHMDAIGYELYCRMLTEAVRRQGLAQGSDSKDLPSMAGQEAQVYFAFAVEAFVPDDYIDNGPLKFELHKSLESARRSQDLRQVVRVIRDRFGALPQPVKRLVRLRALRLQCSKHGITRIERRDRQLRLQLSDGIPEVFTSVDLPELVHVQPEGKTLILFTRLTNADPDALLDFLCRLFALDLGFLDGD